MATTVSDLRRWLSLAPEGTTHMIVVTDTFDFGDYPHFVPVDLGDEPYLIPEHEFTDYARELAEDCGMIPDDTQWPLTCIDWTQAARELRYDYTAVTFDGASFLVRL